MGDHFDVPFKDKNSERKMLYRRIMRITEDIRSRVFDQSIRVTGVEFREGQYDCHDMDKGEWRPFGDEEQWGYREQYCWFRQTVTIPPEFKGREVVYAVDPQPDQGWRSRSFQFIAFIDGEMAQGLDPYHTYVPLTKCAQGRETFHIALNAYCDDWEFRGQGKFHAFLKTRDNVVRDLLYDISVPLEVAHQYDADDLPRIDILKTLNEAVSMLELCTPDDDLFHESAKQASRYLHENLYGESMPVKVSAIGHTHIDTAWLWRVRQSRDKAGRTFSSVIQLMEEYPDFKFMSSQAQLYEFVKQDYPELFEKIRAKVAEGKWEPEGSMWVESDTNIVSGESLVRQFLVGKRFFQKEFGVNNKIMWLPDVFGYSASLPQIMKLADIDYFMTTKISWSEYDRLPFDTFMWKGIDGTEILSHFIPSVHKEELERQGFSTTYNAHLRPDYIVNGWRRYSNKDLNKSWLCSYGFGDGGGGPTREMLENGKRMREGIEGCPKVEPEFARTFFDDLAETVKDNPRLPKWFGELYLQFHRGTLTSQARNKRYNRKTELLMHDCETLCTMAKVLCGKDYPAEELLADWKLILLNQFHDIIPGSSIAPVYEDSKREYEQVLASGRQMASDSMDALISAMHLEKDSLVVFNTLGFTRTDMVLTDVPQYDAFVICDADGAEVPYQITFDGKLLFLAKDVPAKGYKAFSVCAGKPSFGAGKVNTDADSKTFDTPYLYAQFDEQCNIAKLIHKKSGRAVAPEGEVLNRLIAYEDRPNCYEAWELKVYYDEKSWTLDDVIDAQIMEQGALRTVFKVVRPFNSSTVEQYFIFYSDLERIDVQYVIDWHEKNVLLKADYPVDVNASRATYDIQFGNLERTTHNNTTWDYAAFEVCGHKWADLSDNGFGFSVLNDCKYGWTIKEGRICPSILRSAADPNPNQDREVHHVTYSLYPHTGAVSTSGVVQEGYKLNVPLYCTFANAQQGTLPNILCMAEPDKDNVILETVKIAEDSDAVIYRTYETWNRAVTCTLRFDKPIRKAFVTNLMENKDESVEPVGNTLTLDYHPFEIKTLKLFF